MNSINYKLKVASLILAFLLAGSALVDADQPICWVTVPGEVCGTVGAYPNYSVYIQCGGQTVAVNATITQANTTTTADNAASGKCDTASNGYCQVELTYTNPCTNTSATRWDNTHYKNWVASGHDCPSECP